MLWLFLRLWWWWRKEEEESNDKSNDSCLVCDDRMTSIIATGIIMMMMTRVMMMMMTRVMMMMIRMMMMIITMVLMTTAWCAQRIPPDAGGFGGASHPLASFLYQIFTFSPPSYSALLFSPILSIYYTTPAASVLPSQFSIHPTIRTVFAKL